MNAVACVNSPMEPLVFDSLRQQLAEKIGPGIGIACRGVNGDPGTLWPVERAAVLKAVPRRQREFAAGRAAAREAIERIGWPAEAIPSAPDRSPVWPNGLTGSIAHTSHVCVAIAGRRDQVYSMGIDIEEDIPLDRDLWETICTPGELVSMALLPPSEHGRRVTRLFCAKEAFYKWQYPQTKNMLNFCDVQVTLCPTGFRVHPAATRDSPFFFCEQAGRVLTCYGLVLAWLIGRPVSQTRVE